jgi:hypothetical protein
MIKKPELRSLGEFHIIIFLNKLKIVENTPKKLKKIPQKIVYG